MDIINHLKDKVYKGRTVTKEEALHLYEAPLLPLSVAANEIRNSFCGNRFDLCAIINGKNGRCGEDCKFCAQSKFYPIKIDTYALLPPAKIVAAAKREAANGVHRFAIVTSGRALQEQEIDMVCQSMATIREETRLSLCASLGLLNEAQFQKLKAAGVTRIHNNLETSRRFFPEICTSHRYDDKIAAIRAAQSSGLNVCSGGIFGLGETVEDRIDMAFTLKELGIRTVPINILNPIPGTPLENEPSISDEALQRIIAVYRFLLPGAYLRLAGGRGNLSDKGRACFLGGANAAITGDMLTTKGISAAADLLMLKEMGYEVK